MKAVRSKDQVVVVVFYGSLPTLGAGRFLI